MTPVGMNVQYAVEGRLAASSMPGYENDRLVIAVLKVLPRDIITPGDLCRVKAYESEVEGFSGFVRLSSEVGTVVRVTIPEE